MAKKSTLKEVVRLALEYRFNNGLSSIDNYTILRNILLYTDRLYKILVDV
jgi:hypothetical protein